MKFCLVCFTLIFWLSVYAQKDFDINSFASINMHFTNLDNIKFSDRNFFSSSQITAAAGNNCYDSSFTRAISLTNQSVYVDKILHTDDDGILVCGEMYDTTKYQPYTHWDGLIMKMDNKGKILWVKQITNQYQYSSGYILVNTLTELKNHDIIAVATIDTAGGFRDSPIILKLDSNGKLLWYKSLQTSLFSSALYYNLLITAVTEATNGDLILCGSSDDNSFSGSSETVIRMNGQGDVIWDDNFENNIGYTAGAAGISAFVVNGNVVECGLSFGGTNNSYVTAINFLTLNYSTGNLLNKIFFVPNYTNVHKNQNKGLAGWQTKCKLLDNGHYVIYGNIHQQDLLLVDSTDYFGVAEFDAGFNLVNSYLISAVNNTNIAGESIETGTENKIYYSLSENRSENGTDLFFVSDNGTQLSKSRKINYGITRKPASATIATLFNDNSYGFIQSLSSSTNENNNTLEFKKLHDVDTTSDCLGADTLLTAHAPYNLKQDPNFQYLDANISNKVYPNNYIISVSDFTDYKTENGCVQENNCDSVRIHGTANICGVEDAVYFTATRNKNCGAFAQWNIDTGVISSLKQVNDTTVAIRFKNINWNGKLYAHLATASCNINSPQDSIELHVKNQPVAKLSLGNDTILCENNAKLILHAGPNFKTYAWQNGLTDSIFTVTTPGKYFVTVIDSCNNYQSDTINVNGAGNSFKIGNDTTKCNSDTINLKAPGGFTNYSWQPDYNLKYITDNEVEVYPVTDTSYSASAEIAGCFVYDTMHIHVLSSPAISLGNDTSICYGTKILLDAGGEFNQYLWSNDLQTRYIYADNIGAYSVKATANNSCSSYDTINIISVSPLPFVSLGNDTTLYSGDEFTLTPAIKNADKYSWQNGSASPAFLVNQQGEYFLTALNACGSYTDSIKISQAVCKLMLPSAFTPNNDGLNDIFKVKYPLPVKNYKMTIYNRWGQQIFISEEITKGWDGNYKGIPVNPSTYIWMISMTDINNVKTSLHGTVTVIR